MELISVIYNYLCIPILLLSCLLVVVWFLHKRKKILDKSKKYNKNYYVKDDYYLLVKDSDKVETKIKDNSIEVYVNDNLINKVTLFFKRDTSLVFRLKEFIEWWEKI